MFPVYVTVPLHKDIQMSEDKFHLSLAPEAGGHFYYEAALAPARASPVTNEQEGWQKESSTRPSEEDKIFISLSGIEA